MRVHLIDGTYELFRTYYGAPAHMTKAGREVGATRGLVRSLMAYLRDGGITHAAVAFDTVIESFRNGLFSGYKTGEGMDPALYSQFELAERAVEAIGLTVWRMIDFEADDALATGARIAAEDPRVEQVLICSPDKDMAQCVRTNRVVAHDRHRAITLDVEGVAGKFGVLPESIPDYLALVGDTADGIPGIPKWGAKSAATVLAHYKHVDAIPDDPRAWKVAVRGAETLGLNLAAGREAAKLYRVLATLREDVPLKETVDALLWQGARRPLLKALAAELEEPRLEERVARWAPD